MGYVGVTSMGPEQAWVPGLDRPRAQGAGQSGAASEPSLDLYCLVPSPRDPKLQIQAGPPTATASLQSAAHFQPPSLKSIHKPLAAPLTKHLSGVTVTGG